MSDETTAQSVSRYAAEYAAANKKAKPEEAQAYAMSKVPGWVRGTWNGLAFTEEHHFGEGVSPVAVTE